MVDEFMACLLDFESWCFLLQLPTIYHLIVVYTSSSDFISKHRIKLRVEFVFVAFKDFI